MGTLKIAYLILGYTENLICTRKEETETHRLAKTHKTFPRADLFHARYFSSSPLQWLNWSFFENFCNLWWLNRHDVPMVQICTLHAIWFNLKGLINVFSVKVIKNNSRYRAEAEMIHSLVNEDCSWVRTCVFIPPGTTVREAKLVSVSKLPLSLCLLRVLEWGKCLLLVSYCGFQNCLIQSQWGF